MLPSISYQLHRLFKEFRPRLLVIAAEVYRTYRGLDVAVRREAEVMFALRGPLLARTTVFEPRF